MSSSTILNGGRQDSFYMLAPLEAGSGALHEQWQRFSLRFYKLLDYKIDMFKCISIYHVLNVLLLFVVLLLLGPWSYLSKKVSM